MVRASIKASALPLMQANAVRSIRWSCCRTALTQRLVCQPIAGSGLDARLHARQGGVTSIGDVPGERKSVWELIQALRRSGATIQESNDARPLGDAPSRNSSRDWNGTLAAYCHVTPVEQNQNEKQKDTVSGMGATKAVIGNCTPLTHSLFVSDIPRR